MDSVVSGPTREFLNRLTEIFQDSAVNEFDLTCGGRRVDEPGNAIDDRLELIF